MAISLRALTDDGVQSVQEQASRNNLPYVPFALLELVTPQYRTDEIPLRVEETAWENWVGQHESERTEYRPESREELITAVVEKVRAGEAVRAVGSGHSHSNAPEPPEHYIELNPGRPGEAPQEGLKSTLEHEGWLKSDDKLEDVANNNGLEDREAPDDPNTINAPFDQEHLKRVESGIILRRLNRYILGDRDDATAGYALQNIGSFDGQTIAGAVNTSTHGTGIGLPAISDAVMSVEIATVPESVSGDPIVKMYRIEPTDGITDRQAFEDDVDEHEMQLIQDDDIFHSVVVGYGCMGVVYGYTLRVVDNYWLREATRLVAWSELKTELQNDQGEITKASVKRFLTREGTRHCKILVNTATWQVPPTEIQAHVAHGIGQHENVNDPLCLVRRHAVVEPKAEPDDWLVTRGDEMDERWPPERRPKPFRNLAKELIGIHPLKRNLNKAENMHNGFFHPVATLPAFVDLRNESAWYIALRRIHDRGNRETSEYRHPEVPSPPTMSTEMAVPVEDFVDTVDVIGTVVQNVTQGDEIPDSGELLAEGKPVFFPTPIGVRFTAASEHHLSPEFERETAMVELTLPIGQKGEQVQGNVEVPALDFDQMRDWVTEPAMTKAEQLIRNRLGTKNVEPRPHMGKHNTVDKAWLDNHYEYFDASNTGKETGWLQAYERFNAFGTFDNEFSIAQLGLRSCSPDDENCSPGGDTEN